MLNRKVALHQQPNVYSDLILNALTGGTWVASS